MSDEEDLPTINTAGGGTKPAENVDTNNIKGSVEQRVPIRKSDDYIITTEDDKSEQESDSSDKSKK